MSRRQGAKPQGAAKVPSNQRTRANRQPPAATPARSARTSLAGWLPHPVLSVLLAVVWLLLQQSLALPQLITAALLGWAVPRLVGGFLGGAGRGVARPSRRGHWHRLRIALRLAGVVLWDIGVSNLAVARLLLSPRALPQPAWVLLPLDLQHPDAIALLATVITMTPGTVSCVVDERARQILVHVLAGAEPAALVALIKQRYERPIGALFE